MPDLIGHLIPLPVIPSLSRDLFMTASRQHPVDFRLAVHSAGHPHAPRPRILMKGAKPPPVTPGAPQVPFQLCYRKVTGPGRSADADFASLNPTHSAGPRTTHTPPPRGRSHFSPRTIPILSAPHPVQHHILRGRSTYHCRPYPTVIRRLARPPSSADPPPPSSADLIGGSPSATTNEARHPAWPHSCPKNYYNPGTYLCVSVQVWVSV